MRRNRALHDYADSDQTASPVFDLAPDLVTLNVNEQGQGDWHGDKRSCRNFLRPGCDTSQASYQRERRDLDRHTRVDFVLQ